MFMIHIEKRKGDEIVDKTMVDSMRQLLVNMEKRVNVLETVNENGRFYQISRLKGEAQVIISLATAYLDYDYVMNAEEFENELFG